MIQSANRIKTFQAENTDELDKLVKDFLTEKKRQLVDLKLFAHTEPSQGFCYKEGYSTHTVYTYVVIYKYL